MGFALKKLLGAVLMPLPVFLALGAIGWVLWVRGRRPRTGQILVATSLAGLALLSLAPVSDALGRRVEGGYPAFPGDSVAYVVVLGGGHSSDPALPPSAFLEEPSLYRLVEGVRIAQAQPWTTLVLSGWGGTDPRTNADVYQEVAVALGFPRGRTHIEPRPRDTAEEAELLAPLLRGRAFALVTSSTHMTRALTLFRAQGLDPIPAPTGHLVKGEHVPFLYTVIPGENHLRVSRQAWYEMLGRVWARIRGQP